MEKLSAVIIALNEEKNLTRCLVPLKRVADEIVVIDSFSTDKTEEICRQFGASVVQHVFEDYVQQHRRRVERFTTLMAKSHFEQGVKAPALRVWPSPATTFIRSYFFKLGFLDGRAGWRICTISAEATYKKYRKLRKLYKQKQQDR